MTDDLHKIWKRVLEGDAAAWRRLVGRYAALVNSVALRVGLSTPDAEDCAQHTWLTLYRHRRRIRDPQSLPAWLIRTTHRQAVQMSKRLTYRGTSDPSERTADPAARPDEEIQQLEQEVMLARAVELLDPRCRKLITALYLDNDEISYRKLARRLGLAPNSIGSLRSRCLIKLKAIIKDLGFEAD